jgi:hypothetical protein
MTPEKREQLGRVVLQVQTVLREADAAVGPFDYSDMSGWHARHRAEMRCAITRLEEAAEAHIDEKWDGARVRICGIASSSTSGVHGALGNWLKAAAKRLEKEPAR